MAIERYTLRGTPILTAQLLTGDTVTVAVYTKAGASVPLDSNSATENVASSGKYDYELDFTTRPSSGISYFDIRFSGALQSVWKSFSWDEDVTEFDGVVHINTAGDGTAGTDFPTGTADTPVSNLADALTIAARIQTKRLILRGALTLDRSIAGYSIQGELAKQLDSIALANYDVEGTYFEKLTLTGQMNAATKCYVQSCWLTSVTTLNCSVEDSAIAGNLSIMAAGAFTCQDTLSQDKNPVSIDCGGNGTLALANTNGIYAIGNLTNAAGSVAITGMHIVSLLNTCTAGTIYLGGFSLVTDSSNGSTVTNRTYPYAGYNEALAQYTTAGTAGYSARLSSYCNSVYIDTSGGTAGTTYPTGTAFQPSDNLSDAKTIADSNDIKNFVLMSALTLDRAVEGYKFTGSRQATLDIITLNNQSVDGSSFDKVTLTGQCNGSIFCSNSTLDTVTEFDGIYENISMLTSVSVKAGGSFSGNTLYGNSATGTAPTLDFQDYPATLFAIAKFTGLLKIVNFAGALGIVEGDAILELDSTCTGGSIVLTGHHGILTDNSTAGCTVLDARDSSSSDSKKIIGLSQENFRMYDQVYNGDGNLTSGSVKIYPTAADVDADTNEIAEYIITCTWTGEACTSYKVKLA